MSQSDARRARRECKRAGSHLLTKTLTDGVRICAHCGADIPPPPRRGVLTPKMTKP